MNFIWDFIKIEKKTLLFLYKINEVENESIQVYII